MTATEALERRIDELCRENERLRGQVASLTDRSIRMADKMDCLNTENEKLRKDNAKLRGARDVWQENDAKLRELVRDMRTCIVHACMCEFCPLFISEDMDERRCIADMKAHMRELGVDE